MEPVGLSARGVCSSRTWGGGSLLCSERRLTWLRAERKVSASPPTASEGLSLQSSTWCVGALTLWDRMDGPGEHWAERTILNRALWFRGAKHNALIVRPSPLCISGTWSSSPTETLYLVAPSCVLHLATSSAPPRT